MSNTIGQIRERAALLKKHVVFPEGSDLRVQKAARYLIENRICSVTVLHSGRLSDSEVYQTLNYVADPLNIRDFTQPLWKSQQQALGNPDEAQELLQSPLYYAASMVNAGFADACVAGADVSSAEVIRSAIKVIGIKENTDIISSTFLMEMPDQSIFTYADCGVVPYPDKEQLAAIALESARTHACLAQTKPRVAMLSFSTKGSAPHERTQLVRDALQIVKQKDPELIIDGELQFDAAFVPEVARRKAPGSILAGQANVFIFPNLDAGNIAYKMTERLAGAGATGPILQGLKRPMMDLSRGCNVEDIINGACVAILMGEG